MTFAIFYETSDLNWIGGAVNAVVPSLSQADKNLAKKYWQGGVSGWTTAPVGTFPGDEASCPLCHTLVITFGTKAEFMGLCNRIADAIGGDTLYLKAIVTDMAQTAQEPWPPV